MDDINFKIPEMQFKMTITSSLPDSWDPFTRPYINLLDKGDNVDPKLKVSSQELIGIIKEEYVHRQR